MLKIAHLASFAGNIGDVANHIGFYNNVRKYICRDIDVTRFEIRDFYKSRGLRRFDRQFVDEVNNYDVLVIGGGNFFEICWDYSDTATTIDFSPTILDGIQVPIWINGIGFDDTRCTNPNNYSKFADFWHKLRERPRTFASVRNDGSLEMLRAAYGEEGIRNVYKVPDGGFFCQIENDVTQTQQNGNVAICLAKDMTEERFEGKYTEYVTSICRIIEYLVTDYGIRVTLIPHIYSDYGIISDVLAELNDTIRREKVTVTGLTGTVRDFGNYLDCDVVMSMRYHGNVVPIGNDIPTIGLISRPKHGYLYEDLGLKDRMVQVLDSDFYDKTIDLFDSTIRELDKIRVAYKEINANLNETIRDNYSIVKRRLEL